MGAHKRYNCLLDPKFLLWNRIDKHTNFFRNIGIIKPQIINFIIFLIVYIILSIVYIHAPRNGRSIFIIHQFINLSFKIKADFVLAQFVDGDGALVKDESPV